MEGNNIYQRDPHVFCLQPESPLKLQWLRIFQGVPLQKQKEQRETGVTQGGRLGSRADDNTWSRPRKVKPELTVWETRQQRDLLSRALSCSGTGETKCLRRQEWTWEENSRIAGSAESLFKQQSFFPPDTQHCDGPSSILEAYSPEKGGGGVREISEHLHMKSWEIQLSASTCSQDAGSWV